MEDTHTKLYSREFFFSLIILFLWIISFFFSTLKYCLYIYKLKLEENEPNIIDLSGIKSFSFSKTTSNNPEYNPKISNLGYTGQLIFDCYKGECKYYGCGKAGTCNFTEYSSSKLCRNTEGLSCEACNKRYSSYECSCSHLIDSNEYSKEYSCYADNIIYNWKNLYFNRINQTEFGFNYITNSVPANENCPPDKKQCGILDELGNKLCYPKNLTCPINYVTLNSSDKNYTYEEYTIDGVTIYYTNKAIEDGKVLGGFYVDSDLMRNYNIGECQIITTGKISELLNSHKNKLYKNSLNFDPYKDKNIDQKVKAYLKWCIPGVGKERNITLIKKLMEDFKLNKTTNNNINDNIKGMKIFYFLALPGYIITTIIFTITTILIKLRKIMCFIGYAFGFTAMPNTLTLFSIIGSMVSHSEFFEINISNFNQNTFKLLIILNITIFWFHILLTIFIIIFFCYIAYIPNIKPTIDIPKGENNYKSLEDKNTTELQNKNNASAFSAYDNYNKNSNDKTYPLTPEGIN